MKKVLVLGLGDTYGGVEQYFVTRLPYLLNQAQIDFAYPVGINVPYKDKLRGTNLVRIPKLSTPFLYYSYLKNIINTAVNNIQNMTSIVCRKDLVSQ